MLNLWKFIPTLLFASFVAGQLTITKPSSSLWWVSRTENELSWTCKTSDKLNFTVLVSNKDTNVQAAPMAIIAIQPNYDCSLVVPKERASLPAGTGWRVLFANPLNNSEVYATSEDFEVKPPNSAYPTSSLSPSGSGSASGSSPTASGKSSDGVSLEAGLGAISLAAFAIVGLFA